MIKHRRIFWQRLSATMHYTNSDYYYTRKVLGIKLDFETQLIAIIWNMQDKTSGE